MTTHGSAISRLVLVTATLLAAAPVAATARSDYPNRTVKIVVPAPPGAILDILPRIIADRLSARWGQSVVIENRPGAAQNLGAEAVAKAEPDGYTLLVTPPGPLVISQYYYPKLGFDPTAFVPVTIMVTVPPLLVVNPKVPVSTFQELIAYAKANPNKMTYGSPGAGSTPQLAMEKLMSAAGIRLVHVPYQGLAPAQRDLLAGHIDVMIDNLGNALPYIKDAKLKLLAVTTEARSPGCRIPPRFPRRCLVSFTRTGSPSSLRRRHRLKSPQSSRWPLPRRSGCPRSRKDFATCPSSPSEARPPKPRPS